MSLGNGSFPGAAISSREVLEHYWKTPEIQLHRAGQDLCFATDEHRLNRRSEELRVIAMTEADNGQWHRGAAALGCAAVHEVLRLWVVRDPSIDIFIWVRQIQLAIWNGPNLYAAAPPALVGAVWPLYHALAESADRSRLSPLLHNREFIGLGEIPDSQLEDFVRAPFESQFPGLVSDFCELRKVVNQLRAGRHA